MQSETEKLNGARRQLEHAREQVIVFDCCHDFCSSDQDHDCGNRVCDDFYQRTDFEDVSRYKPARLRDLKTLSTIACLHESTRLALISWIKINLSNSTLFDDL